MHRTLVVAALLGALLLSLGACAPRPAAQAGLAAGAPAPVHAVPTDGNQPTAVPATPRPAVPTPTPRAASEGPPQPGMPAAGFALEDLGGEEVSLADYAGRPVLVFFWATWCGYCRREIPDVVDLYAEMADDGLAVLAVDIMEPRDLVAEFAAEAGMEFPVLLDAEARVADRYYVRGVPTNVFIDREGTVVRVVPGAPEKEDLRSYLAELLD
jgi:peroxiredoxin